MLHQYQLAAKALVRRNPDWTQEEMAVELDNVFEETRAKAEKLEEIEKEKQTLEQEITDSDEEGFDDQGLRIVTPKKQSPIDDKKLKKRVSQTEKNTFLQYGVAIENFFNLET